MEELKESAVQEETAAEQEKKRTVKKKETEEPKKLTPEDPGYWEERVPYKPFYDGKYYVDDISVCINGERILIKRDIEEPVMIKRKFLHAIQNAERQQAEAARYEREHRYEE